VAGFGVDGGAIGELGRNIIYRKDGRQEELPGSAQTSVEAGEAIEIVTPTGGGWGAPS
jgi:5-oxoprolinase (ATP-hydrolysing)